MRNFLSLLDSLILDMQKLNMQFRGHPRPQKLGFFTLPHPQNSQKWAIKSANSRQISRPSSFLFRVVVVLNKLVIYRILGSRLKLHVQITILNLHIQICKV